MKNLITRVTTVGLGILLIAGLTSAAPKQKPKAKTVECPVCHMALSAKKTKDNTVAVRLKKGDKTMYCCTKCKMPESVLVKSKAKGKAKVGGTAKK